MRVAIPLLLSTLAAILISGAGCSGKVVTAGDAATVRPRELLGVADKVDLLFVADNSITMRHKLPILARSIPAFLDSLVRPRCVDEAGAGVGKVDDAGACEKGVREFVPLRDLHVGFISSSLGTRGGNLCAPSSGNNFDDGAHLLDRAEGAGETVAEAGESKFLAWLPDVPENQNKPRDPSVIGTAPITDANNLVSAAVKLAAGVGNKGCSYGTPMEAAYRFLVQPDPYERVEINGDVAERRGVDAPLLAQRKAFLRPDSLVVIVMLTDEDESNVAPSAFGGRSWFYTDSKVVRPGTRPCEVDPNSENCLSCYLTTAAPKGGCDRVLSSSSTDHPNLRFFHMKRRFGVDPRYPIERYVRGFGKPKVPAAQAEYSGFDYVGEDKANCVNPLFAGALPSSSGEELCALAPGTRTPNMVHFAIIGGVPWQLLTDNPSDLSNANGAPFKAELSAADWERLLGENALGYRFGGQHPLMQQSIEPRAEAGRDDAHLREWNTQSKELQFACAFELPTPVDCATAIDRGACECSKSSDSPVCDPGSAIQRFASASPTIRAIALAKSLEPQGLVGSICPRTLADPSSPNYGYRPIFDAVAQRVGRSLQTKP